MLAVPRHLVAPVRLDAVVARTTVDAVLAAASQVDPVVAGQGADAVVPGARLDPVGARCPGDLIDAIGSDDQPHEVIGVMPAAFDYPRGTQAWKAVAPILGAVPVRPGATPPMRGVGVLVMVGRLNACVTVDAARDAWTRANAQVRSASLGPKYDMTAVPFLDHHVGPARQAMWVLFAPTFESWLDHRLNGLNLPWGLITMVIVLAVLGATAAAWWPGRTVARLPVMLALSGRPPRPRPVRHSAVAALAPIGARGR